ncbi:hypothetical protein [Phenylobacterium sp. J367]|uniref:hypothetical protein n=1 Tax=Phenylobacterium sp. J367 TaxID=2898435 RepID=UPI002151486B|nr:hypothetical protein [Phenylobacterium sp. J367]MCR5877175.1 hypothetical protein [Phenylobacterium sp. J367]
MQRTVGTGARLGLNQFSPAGPRGEPELADTQRLVGLISTYASAMGVTPEIAVVGLDTPAPRMRWLSTAELSRYGVLRAD